jgi:hypothetical protein
VTKTLSFMLVFAAVAFALPQMLAQSGATLLATTDLDCKWKLDGKPQGSLKADDSITVRVSLGKHLIQATSIDGLDEWKTVIAITQGGQELVQISLKSAHDQRLATAEATAHPTWIDPTTGLEWARRDNNTNVTWSEASRYCSGLRLGSYTNWRLPTIGELTAIQDGGRPYFKGGIKYSGMPWSNSAGGSSKEAWVFFLNSGSLSIPVDQIGSFRALCVRG